MVDEDPRDSENGSTESGDLPVSPETMIPENWRSLLTPPITWDAIRDILRLPDGTEITARAAIEAYERPFNEAMLGSVGQGLFQSMPDELRRDLSQIEVTEEYTQYMEQMRQTFNATRNAMLAAQYLSRPNPYDLGTWEQALGPPVRGNLFMTGRRTGVFNSEGRLERRVISSERSLRDGSLGQATGYVTEDEEPDEWVYHQNANSMQGPSGNAIIGVKDDLCWRGLTEEEDKELGVELPDHSQCLNQSGDANIMPASHYKFDKVGLGTTTFKGKFIEVRSMSHYV